MALIKELTKHDGTTGNYYRLVRVQLPEADKDVGYSKGLLGFNVYVSEEAVKNLGAGIFEVENIAVDVSFFSGVTLPSSFDELAKIVYSNKKNIPGLEDSKDAVDEKTTSV